VSVAVTVTDSRGRTATSTKTVTVLAYSEPTITKFNAERCNSDGTLNDEGEYVKFTYAYTIASLNSKNNSSYSIGYKLKENASYTALTSGSGYSRDTTYLSTSVIFSGDRGYDFKITVSDFFTSITFDDDISTAFTLHDFNASGTAMAIGKVSEKENTLEIALETEFNKPVIVKNNEYVFQSEDFNGATGYALLATITISQVNADSPIVFEIIRRGYAQPMRVYVSFKSSNTKDPELNTITYEGADYFVFLYKSAVSTWKLYVDNSAGWSNPCLQKWYTSDSMGARIKVTFETEQISALPASYYRATPAKPSGLLDTVYPVGSIYWAYDHISPAQRFGGTWARISNRFLWATSEGGDIGWADGESTHTLTVNEMPNHGHTFIRPKWYGSDGNGAYSTTYNASTSSVYGTTSSTTAAYKSADPRNDLNIQATGGGAAHNNMPPYIQVSAWRRTA
jgi:hypothetical protein